MSQTVLLAGATGTLGRQIAARLLDDPDARVRLMVRSTGDAERVLAPLLARGAEVVVGDLTDAASLDRATHGVDVVVSAVQGGPDVIVGGQVALAHAARRNGARRILPSDFALDLFHATPGEHAMFDMRRTADERIAATGLESIHVLQGGFMEMFKPGMSPVDLEAGTVTFWGDGTQPVELTSVADTARMTARVALDRTVGPGKFAFAGDRVSVLDAAAILEQQTGQTLARHSLGTEADLRAAHAAALGDASNPFGAVMLAYGLYMLTGQTALSDLQNDRYPDVALEGFASFAAREITHTADAWNPAESAGALAEAR